MCCTCVCNTLHQNHRTQKLSLKLAQRWQPCFACHLNNGIFLRAVNCNLGGRRWSLNWQTRRGRNHRQGCREGWQGFQLRRKTRRRWKRVLNCNLHKTLARTSRCCGYLGQTIPGGLLPTSACDGFGSCDVH